MLTHPAAMLDDLQSQIRAHRVVPVIGAGFSASVARIPTWTGAIAAAVEHTCNVGICDLATRQSILALVAAGQLTQAAAEVKRLMGAPAGEYPFWLKSTFGTANRTKTAHLPNAIADLMCPLLATTNYDKLLTELTPTRPEAVSWRKTVDLLEAIREGQRVIHLHGVYTDPESVVFGVDNYDQLAASDGYRSVLRTLWLDRTLLFIGCSFGGLRDPDFTALLDWAAATFRGAPAKHYALMWSGEVTDDLVRDFLVRWRIQVIPYGPNFEDLAATIRKLNPNRDEALLRRVRLIADIINHGAHDELTDLANLIDGMAAPERPELENPRAVAEALLRGKRTTALQFRDDFFGLQQLARSMLGRAEIEREIQRYADGTATLTEGPFRRVVMEAMSVLALFPDDLMNALHRRNVNIHGNWLSGYCRDMLLSLSTDSLHAYDAYTLENASRVLITLVAILEANPLEVFLEPAIGTEVLSALGPTSLLIAWQDRLELRNLANPIELNAILPVDKTTTFDTADVVQYQGATAICGFDSEEVFVWDPRRASSPVARFRIDGAYGINGVAHARATQPLISYVTTTDGTVHSLIDLKELGSPWTPFKRKFVSSPVTLNEVRVFGLVQSNFPVVRIGPVTVERMFFTHEEAVKALGRIAPIAAEFERRFVLDQEYLASKNWQVDVGWHKLSLQHPTLRLAVIDGDVSIALYFNIHFFTAVASVILILQEDQYGMGARVAGHFMLPDQIIADFSFTHDETRPILAYALLHEEKETVPLAGWARPTRTSQGWMYVKHGEAVTIGRDLIRVVLVDDDHGYVSDDRGTLFKFRTADGSHEEIVHDEASRIRAIRLVHW